MGNGNTRGEEERDGMDKRGLGELFRSRQGLPAGPLYAYYIRVHIFVNQSE